MHVTLRVLADLDTLRRRDTYHAIRLAMYAVFIRSTFRIIHLSLQRDHVHVLAEANDARALGDGMRAFGSIAARLINAAVTKRGRTRSGAVFADRYHEEIIRTPTQARSSLRYVINNWRKHGEDRGALSSTWLVDPFSSGCVFEGWAELADSPTLFVTRPTYQRLPTWRARTWLLREGWKRAGGLISVRDVPSA